MQKAKISIIIPIYNAELYIEKCVRSLFEQTLDNLEYIFVNDHTLDKSIEILEKILKEYPQRKAQVKIIHNEYNLGQSKTRQKGILAATGNYVIHCDPDDWVDLDWLSYLYNEAIQKKADLVWCGFTKIYEDNSSEYFDNKAQTNKEDALLRLIIGPRWGTLWSNLVKREIVQNKEIKWPTWNYCEDLALIFQYTALAKKIAYINKSLYYYRINSQSISNTKDKNKIIENINGAINAIMIELEYSKIVNLHNQFEPYCLTEIFRAKKRVFTIAENYREGCKLWKQTDYQIHFSDIWKSNMSKKEKIKNFFIYFLIYIFK